MRTLWFDPSHVMHGEGTSEHSDDGPKGVRPLVWPNNPSLSAI